MKNNHHAGSNEIRESATLVPVTPSVFFLKQSIFFKSSLTNLNETLILTASFDLMALSY